jgi:hypothetical protein
MTAIVRTVYVPSNSVSQMNRARARRGVAPSRMKSMKEFLVSDDVQDAADAVAASIASGAALMAHAEIVSDSSSGAYEDSISSEKIPPVVINGNPRAAAAVTAHGGVASWGGFTDPESSHAVVVEYGNPAAPHSGRRILGRAGQPYDSPKRPA